jgi:predicted XRE-type DNA-binding protein
MKGKTRIIESSGNVFEDLLLENPQELTVKARMVLDLARLMRRERLTQKDVAARCKTDQPTISKVLRGRLDLVTLDRLVRWFADLGQDVEFTVRERGRSRAKRQASARA